MEGQRSGRMERRRVWVGGMEGVERVGEGEEGVEGGREGRRVNTEVIKLWEGMPGTDSRVTHHSSPFCCYWIRRGGLGLGLGFHSQGCWVPPHPPGKTDLLQR